MSASKEVESCLDEMDRITSQCALHKWWGWFCGSAWAFFIIYQVAMGLDHAYSERPLCPFSDEGYESWYWYTNFCCLGGFALIWSVLLFKIITKSGNKRVPLFVAFNIVSMGTIATFLALVFNWGGLCIDVLNVASPASIWGEWIACGPLLIFITVTITHKPDLTKMDWFMILTFIACLVTGFFIIPENIGYGWGMFWLIVSCVTYLPVLYLPWYEDVEFLKQIATKDAVHMNQFAERFAQQYNISIWLTIVLPLYTVTYLVAFFNGIDAAQTIVIYQVLSVLTKGLFAAAVMDLHVDILVETEKALVEERRANNARRAFMKYIFHEVRTPLNSLMCGIDFMGMSPDLTDQEKECLAMMHTASQFMGETLDDVLSIQKIEEGKFELEIGPLSFKTCILTVFVALRGAILQKNIAATTEISPDTPPLVVGDERRITHVIMNLMSNAIKFSPPNKAIKVVVRRERDHEHDFQVRNGSDKAVISVAIQDEGPGIAPEDQARLFNSFVQIRPEQLQAGKGSGLGLSFCKAIVELHRGTIGMTSRLGNGSQFKFTIPFDIVVGDEKESQQDVCDEDEPLLQIRGAGAGPGPVSGPGPALLRPAVTEMVPTKASLPVPAPPSPTAVDEGVPLESMKFLVVDDVESNRKMVTMLLKRKKVDNEGAVDGLQAVDMVLTNLRKYHVVLMDNLMPRLDGVAATKRLRAEGYAFLIIGLTGNVMDEDIAEYLEAGADLVLAKPVKGGALDAIIKLVETMGPASRPGMRLVEVTGTQTMRWVPRQTRAIK